MSSRLSYKLLTSILLNLTSTHTHTHTHTAHDGNRSTTCRYLQRCPDLRGKEKSERWTYCPLQSRMRITTSVTGASHSIKGGRGVQLCHPDESETPESRMPRREIRKEIPFSFGSRHTPVRARRKVRGKVMSRLCVDEHTSCCAVS